MERHVWRPALKVGAMAAALIGVLGLVYGIVTERPVYGGDGSVIRSVLVVTVATFVGATLGMLGVRAIGRRRHSNSA